MAIAALISSIKSNWLSVTKQILELRLIFILVMSVLSVVCFGQKDIYLNIEVGTGSSFVHLLENNASPENFKSVFTPSFTLGVGTRYDFTERFSGIIGVFLFNHGYGTKYTHHTSVRLWETKNYELQRFISFPTILQTNFKIHKVKTIYLSLLTGLNLGIKTGYMQTGGTWSFLNEAGDSITAAAQYWNNIHRVSLNLLMGIGLERKSKNSSRLGIKLFALAGMLKTYEGRLEVFEYDNPIPYSQGDRIVINKQPDKITNFFSMNTSWFITFYYAFNITKRKKA